MVSRQFLLEAKRKPINKVIVMIAMFILMVSSFSL
jgi:hypothetical protein